MTIDELYGCMSVYNWRHLRLTDGTEFEVSGHIAISRDSKNRLARATFHYYDVSGYSVVLEAAEIEAISLSKRNFTDV